MQQNMRLLQYSRTWGCYNVVNYEVAGCTCRGDDNVAEHEVAHEAEDEDETVQEHCRRPEQNINILDGT